MKTTSKDYQTIRIWQSTLQKLRLLYALTGRPMVEILDELVTAALAAVEARKESPPV